MADSLGGRVVGERAHLDRARRRRSAAGQTESCPRQYPQPFNPDQSARHYLAGCYFVLKRRLEVVGMSQRNANAVCYCMLCLVHSLLDAEIDG